MALLSYGRHLFPPPIIQHAIWLYLRFTLSYRDVEDLLAERGLDLSYETVPAGGHHASRLWWRDAFTASARRSPGPRHKSPLLRCSSVFGARAGDTVDRGAHQGARTTTRRMDKQIRLSRRLPDHAVLLELAPADRTVAQAGRAAYAARLTILTDKLVADEFPARRAERLAGLCVSAIQGALI